jgi:transcriptional regulator with XRE-family HTH domain
MGNAVAEQITDLKERGGLQGRDIANIMHVSPATVSRWHAGTASPTIDVQTIIADLRYVVVRLSDFYTSDETRLWLSVRHELLGQERPLDLIAQDRMKEVLAVIDRLDAGVYI